MVATERNASLSSHVRRAKRLLLLIVAMSTLLDAPPVLSRSHAHRTDTHAQVTTTVPRYGVFELVIDYDTNGSRWYDLSAVATFATPSGASLVVDGFYYRPDQVGLRFIPTELGDYNYTMTISRGPGGDNSVTTAGRFISVHSDSPGFIRRHPSAHNRLMYEDGSVFFGSGLNDCWDMPKSGGFTGHIGDPSFEPDGEGGEVPIDQYFDKYSTAGFNIFRYNNGNCMSWDAWSSIERDINAPGLFYTDTILASAKAHGLPVMLTLFQPGGRYHGAEADPQVDIAFRRFLRYIVARWGAYVTVWEWANESDAGGISDAWLSYARQVLLSIDPYDRLMSNSHPRGTDDRFLDFQSPHYYDIILDKYDPMENLISGGYKSGVMPVIVGEAGRSGLNWSSASSSQMRVNAWTAFFGGAGIVWWNTSYGRHCRCNNMYLGSLERKYNSVLRDFSRSFDAGATSRKIESSNTSVTSYSLASRRALAVYSFQGTLGASGTVATSFTVEIPFEGVAEWIDPKTGAVVQSSFVSAGTRTFTTPTFIEDMVLRIVSPSAPAPSTL